MKKPVLLVTILLLVTLVPSTQSITLNMVCETKIASFDGVDDYVEIPFSDTLNITDKITVEVLMYNLQTAAVSEHVVGTQYWGWKNYRIWVRPNWLEFEVSSDGTTDNVVLGYLTDTIGKWYHVIGVNDKNGKARLYVNGELKKEQDGAAIYQAGKPITIGAVTPGMVNQFKGYIALVRIYNRSLSSEEIEWNYEHPFNPIRNGLVLWFDGRSFRESIWEDLSGNNNHGTPYGVTLEDAYVFQDENFGLHFPVKNDTNPVLVYSENATISKWEYKALGFDMKSYNALEIKCNTSDSGLLVFYSPIYNFTSVYDLNLQSEHTNYTVNDDLLYIYLSPNSTYRLGISWRNIEDEQFETFERGVTILIAVTVLLLIVISFWSVSEKIRW